MNHGHSHKNEVRKAPKETVFDEAVRLSKKRHVPAPGHYSLPSFKIQNTPIDKQIQMQMALDCAYKAS